MVYCKKRKGGAGTEHFRRVVAQNIITLRTRMEMTQSELGEKLNYSDKSVSKWERAESLPDAFVLKQMAGIFGVSVDWLLEEHEGGDGVPLPAVRRFRPGIVLLLSLAGVFTAATLAFVALWIAVPLIWWEIFVWAVPVSAVTALVLCSVWYGTRYHPYILSVLVWGLLASVYVTLPGWENWQLFLLGIPSQIVVLLVFRVKKPRRTGKRKKRDDTGNGNDK